MYFWAVTYVPSEVFEILLNEADQKLVHKHSNHTTINYCSSVAPR